MGTSGRTVAAALVTVVLTASGLVLGAGGVPASAQSGRPPMIAFVVDKILSPTVLGVGAEVAPSGSATTVFVRYGETTAYGLTSGRQSIGSGMTPVNVTWQLRGLHRSTTYDLQVVATSSAGRAASPNVTIQMPMTPLTPPKVTPTTVPHASVGNADKVRAVPVSMANAAFSALNDVSCAATTFCLAVGLRGTSATHVRPLVERFGGRAFSLLASPAPWGAQLMGIACRTAEFCLAVGSEGNNAFSERWSGKGWRVLSTPSPRLDGGDQLVKVACVSMADCFSIGVENGGTRDARPLVEHWNGAAWSLVATPSVPAPVLESISCPSSTSCFVVGIKDGASGLGRPLIEHWNGRAFVLSAVPPIGGQLFSVSCGGPASCVTVGNAGGKPLLLDLAGGSWHVIHQLRFTNLSVTACVSPSSCYAAGGVTAHWNGRAWALGRPVAAYGNATGGAQGAELQGLSCPAPTECVGVGARGSGSLGSEHAIANVIIASAPASG